MEKEEAIQNFKQRIHYYDTIYKRSHRITLQCLLTQINNKTLDTSGTKVYFATMDLLEEFKNKYYKQQWRLDQKTAVQEYFLNK